MVTKNAYAAAGPVATKKQNIFQMMATDFLQWTMGIIKKQEQRCSNDTKVEHQLSSVTFYNAFKKLRIVSVINPKMPITDK